MAKKLKVVALVGVIHTITQGDLDSYPHLVSEGVKVGEDVLIGNDVKMQDVIETLEADNAKLKAEKDISAGAINNLSNHVVALKDELTFVKGQLSEFETNENIRISDLEKKLKEANNTISLNVENNKSTTVSPKAIVVHHGVVVNGKKFTKEQIENDSSIQEVLLEMGSTAVTKIEG